LTLWTLHRNVGALLGSISGLRHAKQDESRLLRKIAKHSSASAGLGGPAILPAISPRGSMKSQPPQLHNMSQSLNQLPEELQLATSAHVKYIQSLDSRKDEYDYWLTEHLRLNGLYWGLTALHLLGKPNALPRTETIDFVLSCQHENGGFGAAPGHDAHMLSTVSAVQILATVDAFDELETRGKGKAQVGQCASPGMAC
jgi:hypothetical protein